MTHIILISRVISRVLPASLGTRSDWVGIEMSIASSAATFYWQLTGVINQDIPPDSQGRPLEFCRYVGYFLDRYPGLKKEPCLMELVTGVYLDAVKAGREPRQMVREASYRASIVHRRVKYVPEEAQVTLRCGQREKRVPLQDVVAAIILDHGEHLLEHWFDQHDEAMTLSVSGSSVADSWLRELESFIRTPEAGCRALRRETEVLVRPMPRKLQARLLDKAEAVLEGTSDFFSLLRATPRAALIRLFREFRSAPRLIPTWIYVAGILPLFAWILIEAGLQVKSPIDVLMYLGAVFVGLWTADAVSYVIHMDRDGWGNSVETRAFQDHHLYPGEVAHWTIRRSVGTVAHGVLLLMVLLVLVDPAPMLQLALGIMLWSFLFVTWTHRWAHTPPNRIPRWIRLMQKYRLIISVEFHAIHHRTLNSSWGIFNGWSCFVFDAIRFQEMHTRIRNRLFGEVRPLWEKQIAERAAMKIKSVPSAAQANRPEGQAAIP